MNKLEFKQQVLTKAKETVKKIIADLQTEIARTKEREVVIDEGQLDAGQMSQDEAAYEVADELIRQVNFANRELQLLERMQVQEPLLDTVAPGAVVKTDQRTFYISVGIEDFMVAGKEIFAISPNAPIFEEMKGRKAGESFSFRDIKYRIEEVF